MNLPDFGAESLFGIMSLLLVLVMWGRILMNKRAADRELDRQLLERQERLDAERARQSPPVSPPPPSSPDNRKGPWG